MTGLEELRQALVDHLNRGGVSAVAAWEKEKRLPLPGAVSTVCLRGCTGGPAGFRDYLGEFWDEEKGRWVERYGRRAEITFGLDIWAPRNGGEIACATHFSGLVQALALGGPCGLRFRELTCGETVFDEKEGVFHCPAQAVGEVFLEATLEENGAFTDFTVKGTRT